MVATDRTECFGHLPKTCNEPECRIGGNPFALQCNARRATGAATSKGSTGIRETPGMCQQKRESTLVGRVLLHRRLSPFAHPLAAVLSALPRQKGGVRVNRSVPLRSIGTTLSVVAVCILLGMTLTPARVVEAVRMLACARPIALLGIPLYLVWNLAAARGWQSLVVTTAPAAICDIGRLLVLRLAAQSINATLPTGGAGGEVMRATALTRLGVGLHEGSMATLADNFGGICGGVAFALVVATIETPRLSGRICGKMWCIAVAMTAGILLLFWLVRRVLRHTSPYQRRWFGASSTALLSTIATKRFAVAFGKDVIWRWVERFLMAAEIWLYFRALGHTVDYFEACIVVVALVLASFAFFLIPAQLGAAEAMMVAAASIFGAPPNVVFGVSLLRRSRQLVTSLGGLFLVPLVVRMPGRCRGAESTASATTEIGICGDESGERKK